MSFTIPNLGDDGPSSADGATGKVARKDDIGAQQHWAPDATIYIYRDGATEGPYSAQEIREAQAFGKFQPSDKVWSKELKEWIPVLAEAKPAPIAAPLRKTCPQCQAEMPLQTENPQRGTGTIMIVLGILFAPFCVGIPLLIWGIVLTSETRSYWHCRGCGRTFPF